jgi:hypothetical protein
LLHFCFALYSYSKNEEIIAIIEKYFNKNNIGNEIFLEIGEEDL